jgi:hypothetical protein
VGVIARPARRITCQRASPRRTMTEPRPDLGDEQRQSAAQRLGCDRTVPPLPRAEHDLQSVHVAHRLGASRRPGGHLSGTHRVSRAVAAIHPELVRAQLEIRMDTARGARRRPLAGRSANALSIRVPRLEGISCLVMLSASGNSKEGR